MGRAVTVELVPPVAVADGSAEAEGVKAPAAVAVLASPLGDSSKMEEISDMVG